MKISKPIRELLKSRIGYRNNYISTGIYTIDKIIEHETKVLGNEDIYFTCEELYNIEDPFVILNKTFGRTDVFGLWLARREDVLKYYMSEFDHEISKYNIPDKVLLLSDLGDEGALFAFEEDPDDLLIDVENVLAH